MSDFSKEINNFQKYGTYVYKFDNVGNITFDSSSIKFNQVYIAFPLRNIIYGDSKINTIYNTEFEEFIPQIIESTVVDNVAESNIQTKLDIVQEENTTLKAQLDSIISISESTSSEADKMAVKEVILELRKTIGQGRVDSDFSESFPYTPIRKDNI